MRKMKMSFNTLAKNFKTASGIYIDIPIIRKNQFRVLIEAPKIGEKKC